MKPILFLHIILLPLMAISQQKQNASMSHILKNKNVEILVDLPKTNYNLSRFDWTGKIVSVKYKNMYVSGVERMDCEDDLKCGKGFYNEFGIDAPIAYDETKEGERFHKIGIGLLKKEGKEYRFFKDYEIEPAHFQVTTYSNRICIECKAQGDHGRGYVLKKEIELLDRGFIIKYDLHNSGDKTISTNEYCHNFLAINKDLIGSNYLLRFPFLIRPELFGETVNPEEIVEIGQKEIRFNGTPEEQFFFSNISGSKNSEASWELINTKHDIGIRETGSFKASKVNLWGWKHVISPELFFDINVEPGQSVKWSRSYDIYDVD